MSGAVCLQVGWLKYSCQVLSIFGDESIISPTLRREPTFRATHKNKRRFPGFSASSPHNIWGFCRALSVPDGRRQTRGRHPSRTQTHAHPFIHCEHGKPGHRGNCRTVRCRCWQRYSCEQGGFEGKTNASAVPLAFSSHFLKEIVFGVVWCLRLLPCGAASARCPAEDAKQERRPDSSLLRDAPLTLPLMGSLFCYSSTEQRTKCWHTSVQDSILDELILAEVYEGLNMSQTLCDIESGGESMGSEHLNIL